MVPFAPEPVTCVLNLERAAAEGWITLTELADSLTRNHGLPFRSAHGIAARSAAQ